MGNKRTGRCTAGNGSQNRSFNLQKIPGIKIVTNRLYDIGPCYKGIHNLRIHNQINITLTITDFCISKAMEFFRQWPQRLGQQIKSLNSHSQLPTVGTEHMPLYPNNITYIQQLELLVFFFPQNIQLKINLDTAGAVH